MWHPRGMPSLLRGALGLAVVVSLGVSAALGSTQAVPSAVSQPAVQDDVRDPRVSRADARPAVLPAVEQSLNQRVAALEQVTLQIALTSRDLRTEEFTRQRKAAEAKLRYAAKVKAQGYDPKTTNPRAIARQLMKNKFDWGKGQFGCLNKIFTQESQWKWNATNPSSGAYGIPQSLPAKKMASAGKDWKTNPATQIRWGLKYIKDRYGTPCKAWAFKRGAGWY